MIKNNKLDFILNVLTLFFCFFVVLAYSAYIGYYIMLHTISGVYILPITVITIVLFPILIYTVFSDRLKRKLPRVLLFIRILFLTASAFYTITFSAFCVNILYSEPADTDNTDIVLVFGAKTNGYTPSKLLSERLELAYNILNENPNSICIVSGGTGNDEVISEAESMSAYLQKKGINASRIIKEEQSTRTEENISFSKEIIDNMQNNSLKTVGVSNDFHIKRIEIIARKYDMNITVAGSRTDRNLILFANMVREYMAYVKMYLTI